MTYRARIYLRLAPTETKYHYIGEIDLDRRPVEKGQIPLKRQGKIQLGSIESVSPVYWEKRGVIPVLHVVLSPDETPEEKPRRKGRGLVSIQEVSVRLAYHGPNATRSRLITLGMPAAPMS